MNKDDLISEWLKKAEKDYSAADQVLYKAHPALTEISCYHSQQCVEKSLKAFLVYHDIDPPFTHDLGKLCILCEGVEESFSSVAHDCGDLSQYATRTRYPDETEIIYDEAEVVLKRAKNVFEFVTSIIPSPGLDEKPEELSDKLEEETAP